jgi:hypothetical protein
MGRCALAGVRAAGWSAVQVRDGKGWARKGGITSERCAEVRNNRTRCDEVGSRGTSQDSYY